MALIDLTDWLNEFSGHQYAWFVKRLSGNDTLANKAHQAGPYLPKKFAFEMFPTIETIKEKNPRKALQAYIDSHPDSPEIRAIYYNSKLR